MAGSVDPLKGSVKWFDSKRGFGFIAPVGGGQDLFVHQSSITAVGPRSLTAGEAVEFVVSVGDDGRSSAVSVTGPGGACIQGQRYFLGACFRCSKVGHMARDCKSNRQMRPRFLGIPGSCYRGGEIQTLTRGLFPAMQPTNILNLLKLDSLSPLPDKSKTLVGRVERHELRRKGRGRDEKQHSEVSSEHHEPKSGAEWRNWAELPRDILLIIFKKIAVAEILSSAQSVCRPWRQLSHDPTLWRCIDLRMYDRLDDMVAVVMMAVDRSAGCLEELYIGYFSTDELMHYIAERATRLRGLHLISVGIYEATLVETLRKLPLLEELEISRCYCFNYKIVEQVGEACPQLKSFRLDDRVPTYPLYLRCDSRKNVSALAIANHFKQLRRLRLFSNCLNNIGLLAILDNCPYLEHLDVRYCFNVDFLDGSLKNKCVRIKELRLPNDSIVDYEYGVDEVVKEDSDITHLSDTDYDLGYSDDDYNCFNYYGSSDLSDFDDAVL